MPFFQPIPGETPITDISELKVTGILHPFENGNGRWSRALANLWLYLHGQEPTDWPGTALSEESAIREEYMEAIQAADKGNHGPLLALHERFTSSEEE